VGTFMIYDGDGPASQYHRTDQGPAGYHQIPEFFEVFTGASQSLRTGQGSAGFFRDTNVELTIKKSQFLPVDQAFAAVRRPSWEDTGKSQSLRPGQGSADEAQKKSLGMRHNLKSQTIRPDQGSADVTYNFKWELDMAVSQSLRADQGSADRRCSRKSPASTTVSCNPTVLIRALPTLHRPRAG
jgi:hypothetical protein